MKRILFAFIALISIVILSACGTEKTDGDTKDPETTNVPIEKTNASTSEEESEAADKKKVETYLNEVAISFVKLGELSERWNELRQSSADGEISDVELGEIISNEILPTNMNHLEELEAIPTTTEETTEINEMAIEFVGDQQLAFTEILSAIETGDSSKITSANAILNEVRKTERETVRKLESLVEKHGIEF